MAAASLRVLGCTSSRIGKVRCYEGYYVADYVCRLCFVERLLGTGPPLPLTVLQKRSHVVQPGRGVAGDRSVVNGG